MLGALIPDPAPARLLHVLLACHHGQGAWRQKDEEEEEEEEEEDEDEEEGQEEEAEEG